MAETWPFLLFRPGNEASPCTRKDQTQKYTGLSLGDADPYNSWMEEQVAIPLDHSLILDYGVLWTSLFIVVKGLKISRTWLYWHAGTFDVSACLWLFNNVPHFWWWLMFSIIGASAATPTLVVKTEIVSYVRIPYIHILPHLCAMQYFHIAVDACWPLLFKRED